MYLPQISQAIIAQTRDKNVKDQAQYLKPREKSLKIVKLNLVWEKLISGWIESDVMSDLRVFGEQDLL